MVETSTISLHKGKDAQKRAYQTTIIVVETENALDAMGKVIIQIIRMEKRKIIFAQPAMELNNVQLAMVRDSDKKVVSTKNIFVILFCIICSHINAQEFVDLGLSVNWCTANIGALATNQLVTCLHGVRRNLERGLQWRTTNTRTQNTSNGQ